MTDKVDFEELGLINQDLFQVNGELASRYNGVLKKVFDLDCDADSFRIDKRGLSPELSKYFKEKYPDRFEFGENYLNLGTANQFMIVLSPDQKNAPLIAPQTSYEDKLYDIVYKNARHTIESITEGQALFGELDNHITKFRSAEDLLQLRTIELSLDTIQESVKASSKLKELSDGLDAGNNALDSSYIEKMLQMVKTNVPAEAISDIFPIKMEVHCFYAEFFNGVHCLRNFKNRDDVNAIFVYHNQKKPKNLGEAILNFDVHDPELIDTLYKYNFIRYNSDLIEKRLGEIEDEVLLGKGIDVVNIPSYERKRFIMQHEKEFPDSWNEIRKIKTILNNSETKIEYLQYEPSLETKVKLMEPATKEDIINHMFAELDPTDIGRVYKWNKRKFITEFSALPLNRKDYIAKVILNKYNDKGGSE